MSDPGSCHPRASATREVAYPVKHVWQAMATLLPYCSVCNVSAIADGAGELGVGTGFRAFSGQVAEQTDQAARAGAVEGGMPGQIVEWSPQRCVATRLETGSEIVVVRVEMETAGPVSPDTTMVTISVEVRPHLRSRLAAAMARSSYTRLARRTVEGEIEKLPAHLALLEEGD